MPVNLDDRLSQLVREALAPMLAELFGDFEERLVQRLAGVDQSQQAPASSPPPLLTQIKNRTVLLKYRAMGLVDDHKVKMAHAKSALTVTAIVD